MKFNLLNVPSEIENVLLLSENLELEISENGIPVTVSKTLKGISLKYINGAWVLEYSTIASFARALSLLKQFQGKDDGFAYEEHAKFDSLGVMIDCSRNAVPTITALKKMLVRLVLMGYTNVQLYTEDTFEIEGYTYFGYLRGAYTQAELREIDAFAISIGIEIVPCIQTLAHLLHALKWQEFDDMWDCNDILMCGEEKTYELIDAMFKAMSTAFKSRNINIGMDEAHMLGLGKYLDKNGYENRFNIMLSHLTRVTEIARKYGYRPMMWSDMFFRLANGGEYYASGKPIDPKIIQAIPDDVSLVYWDYYSEDEQRYYDMMQSHKEFGCKIIFAGAVWKWTGFTPENAVSMKIAKLASNACSKSGVRDVLVTCWGDNGAEASMFSVLPTLTYWAESCWANTDEMWVAKRFETCCGISYDDFMLMDTPLFLPGNPCPGVLGLNPPKYYFYQDTLLGMADCTNQDDSFSTHFSQCAEKLMSAAKRNPKWSVLLKTQAELCHVLELKVTIGIKLRAAYRQGNKDELNNLANIVIPDLIKRLSVFQKAYHTQWFAENKPFGVDNFDIRSGGVKQRLITAAERINAYLQGEINHVEELETDILPYAIRMFGHDALCSVHWEKIATPSSLFWM